MAELTAVPADEVAQLPGGSVVMLDRPAPRRAVVLIRDFPSQWSPWRGTDGGYWSDEVLRHELSDPRHRLLLLLRGGEHG